jgi:sulfite exporter TauE/SafE
MAAFGAGTLPWLLSAGVAAAKLRGWTGLTTLRRLGGALLVALGGLGIAHASGLGASVRQAFACF